MQHDLRLAQPFLTRVGIQIQIIANLELDDLVDVENRLLVGVATGAVATKESTHDEQQVWDHGRADGGSHNDHATKALKEAELANGTTRKLACEFAFE